jgi:hypothetical protein
MAGTTGEVAAATTPEVYVFDPANFPEPRNITNEFFPLEVGTVGVSEVAGVEYTVGTVPDAAFPIAGSTGSSSRTSSTRRPTKASASTRSRTTPTGRTPRGT